MIIKTLKTSCCMALVLAGLSLSSCELTQNYLKQDRENNMEMQDYRDALAPRQPDITKNSAEKSLIPPLQPYIALPNSSAKAMPLVSVAVNQTIPLRDVIYEIARQANYDVELDPRIRGSIIFSARNRPLDMVIDRISEIAGLRYKFDDDMLRVELDTPYHETYKINYLALTRTNSSSIANDISVVSAGENSNSESGSTFNATNESVIDFWTELETNLTQIVQSNRDTNRLATTIDPQITVADSNPAPVAPIIMDDQGNIVETGPNVQVQAPQAVLNVNNIPEENTNQNDPNAEDPFAARFSLNRQAGLISVFAPQRLHKEIAEYLNDIKKSVTSQVLIEAKVLEVQLNDEYSAGVEWNALFGDRGGVGFGRQVQTAGGFVRGLLETDGSIASNAAASLTRGDFNIEIDALSRFGTVSALASPRITVLNNQVAALNVAENVVFFEVEATTDTADGVSVTTFETDARTVPEGVLINVHPAIDLDNQSISMAIRPTVTNVVGFEEDPNPSLATAGVTSEVPIVNVQEFDSIIQMNNGQAVVLGGLMQDSVRGTTNSVPVLGEVPLLGGLFRNQEDSVQKTELVVFLKATIVEGGNTIHATDKDLYRTFSSDRRPFKM